MEVLVPSQSILEKLQLKDERNLLIQGLPSTIEKQFVKVFCLAQRALILRHHYRT